MRARLAFLLVALLLTPALVAQPAAADRALLDGAIVGDTEALRQALAAGGAPEIAAPSGATPLILATRSGALAAVRTLVDAGANPTRKGVLWLDSTRTGYYGNLTGAAGEGHTDVLAYPLDDLALPVDDRERDPHPDDVTALQNARTTLVAWQDRAGSVPLAGANAGVRGRLTAEELVGPDLRGTDLVVLSACETGRGSEVTGQGVLGLQASFLAAGTRTLVMSLWKVPDASTAMLMEAFYHGLWEEGLGPAAALRESQAEVRAAGYTAPVHWAGWVLAGEAW